MIQKVREMWRRVTGWLGPVLLMLLGLIILLAGAFQLRAGQVLIGLLCIALGGVNFQITRMQRRGKDER